MEKREISKILVTYVVKDEFKGNTVSRKVFNCQAYPLTSTEILNLEKAIDNNISILSIVPISD